MRVPRCVPTFAAAIAATGLMAPNAVAFDAGTSPAPAAGSQAASAHHSDGSVDWLIGIGTAAGIAVLGTGVAAGLRERRSAEQPHVMSHS